MRRCLVATRLITRGPWNTYLASTPAVRYIGHSATSRPSHESPSKAHDQPKTTASQTPPSSQDGSSANQSPSVTANLPLSPLLDPKLIAARERHRRPKPAPSGELSPFSKKLQSNPYGTYPIACISHEADLHTSSSSRNANPSMQIHRREVTGVLPPQLRVADPP